jgi:hypothetical protein
MPTMLKTEYLGTFTKLREATIGFVIMSVHLYIPKEQLGSHAVDFMKFDIEYFSNICQESSS